MSRTRRDYQRGVLDAEELAIAKDEAEGADAHRDQMRAQMAEIESGPDLSDAETDVLEKLARIRAAIAGEIQDAEGIAAVRATLLRLFDRFILHPGLPEKAHVELASPERWIEPVLSEQAIEGYDEKLRPVLRREPLCDAENNYRQGSPWR